MENGLVKQFKDKSHVNMHCIANNTKYIIDNGLRQF